MLLVEIQITTTGTTESFSGWNSCWWDQVTRTSTGTYVAIVGWSKQTGFRVIFLPRWHTYWQGLAKSPRRFRRLLVRRHSELMTCILHHQLLPNIIGRNRHRCGRGITSVRSEDSWDSVWHQLLFGFSSFLNIFSYWPYFLYFSTVTVLSVLPVLCFLPASCLLRCRVYMNILLSWCSLNLFLPTSQHNLDPVTIFVRERRKSQLWIWKPDHLINTLKEITEVFHITLGGNLLLERLGWVVDGINCNTSKKKSNISKVFFFSFLPVKWQLTLQWHSTQNHDPLELHTARGNKAIRGFYHKNKCYYWVHLLVWRRCILQPPSVLLLFDVVEQKMDRAITYYHLRSANNIIIIIPHAIIMS